MASQSKIYLLKDRKDYVKKLTNDKIINIIGTKGLEKQQVLISILIMIITWSLIVIAYMICQLIMPLKMLFSLK